MKKYLLILLMICSKNFIMGQGLDIERKVWSISFLTQGNPSYVYHAPSETEKGNYRFNFQCKENYFSPDEDSAASLAPYLVSAVTLYAFADSLDRYDSLIVVFLPFDSTTESKWGTAYTLSNRLKIPHTNEEDRMGAIFNILPFGRFVTWEGDSVKVILKVMDGYSPPSTLLPFYSKVLAYVIHDYVFKKEKKIIEIIYRNIGKERAEKRFILNSGSFNEAFLEGLKEDPNALKIEGMDWKKH